MKSIVIESEAIALYPARAGALRRGAGRLALGLLGAVLGVGARGRLLSAELLHPGCKRGFEALGIRRWQLVLQRQHPMGPGGESLTIAELSEL